MHGWRLRLSDNKNNNYLSGGEWKHSSGSWQQKHCSFVGQESTSRLQIRIKIKLLLPLEQLSTYLLMPGILEHIIDQPNNEKDRDDCEK